MYLLAAAMVAATELCSPTAVISPVPAHVNVPHAENKFALFAGLFREFRLQKNCLCPDPDTGAGHSNINIQGVPSTPCEFPLIVTIVPVAAA